MDHRKLDAQAFRRLMERLATAWSGNETPLALAFFTEDVSYSEPPDLQSYRGHNRLRVFFDELTPGTTMRWHHLWFDEETQTGAGEYTFQPGGWQGEANHGVAVVQLRGGLIASWREYQRRGAADFDEFAGTTASQVHDSGKESAPAALASLRSLLERIPAVSSVAAGGDGSGWWVKFTIEIDSPIAWHVVQELGHLLNYISLDERLPTVFMPVSPPPYLNGGPEEFLSWVIESRGAEADPSMIAAILRGRLPQPLEDESAWASEEEDDSDQ